MRPALERIHSIIAKHRRSALLIDANLLLLWLVGKTDVSLISSFKRTSAFVVSDFRLLDAIVLALQPRLVATPNVLTEVSNLANSFHDPVRSRFFLQLKQHIEGLDERYLPSEAASNHREFSALGLTDCTIIELARNLPALVLTVDALLTVALAREGVDAINFNHLRPLDWD